MHSSLECALCCYVQFCALPYSCSCLAVHCSCGTLSCSCNALPCSTFLQLYCPAIACLAAAFPCSSLQLHYRCNALQLPYGALRLVHPLLAPSLLRLHYTSHGPPTSSQPKNSPHMIRKIITLLMMKTMMRLSMIQMITIIMVNSQKHMNNTITTPDTRSPHLWRIKQIQLHAVQLNIQYQNKCNFSSPRPSQKIRIPNPKELKASPKGPWTSSFQYDPLFRNSKDKLYLILF